MKSRSISSPVPSIERRRLLAGAVGAACLAPLPASWAQGRGMSPVPGQPPAPPLRLPDIDDRIVDLAALRGKVVLVNFWATWCPPCRKEFPSLGRVRKLFKPSEFEVLAVNVGEDPETVFSFAGAPAFPVLFDRDSQAMAGWPVMGLPTTFLVDRRGRLVAKAVGGREFDDPAIVTRIKQRLKSPKETI
jgi:thiol-disulfide isomerase/thioredoxin